MVRRLFSHFAFRGQPPLHKFSPPQLLFWPFPMALPVTFPKPWRDVNSGIAVTMEVFAGRTQEREP